MAVTVKVKTKLTGQHAQDFKQEMKKLLEQMGVKTEPKGSSEEQGQEN